MGTDSDEVKRIEVLLSWIGPGRQQVRLSWPQLLRAALCFHQTPADSDRPFASAADHGMAREARPCRASLLHDSDESYNQLEVSGLGLKSVLASNKFW